MPFLLGVTDRPVARSLFCRGQHPDGLSNCVAGAYDHETKDGLRNEVKNSVDYAFQVWRYRSSAFREHPNDGICAPREYGQSARSSENTCSVCSSYMRLPLQGEGKKIYNWYESKHTECKEGVFLRAFNEGAHRAGHNHQHVRGHQKECQLEADTSETAQINE